MPRIKRNVDRNAIQEALRDLETSIEAYLVEWRRKLGIQRGPETSTNLKELRLEAIEREKHGDEVAARRPTRPRGTAERPVGAAEPPPLPQVAHSPGVDRALAQGGNGRRGGDLRVGRLLKLQGGGERAPYLGE